MKDGLHYWKYGFGVFCAFVLNGFLNCTVCFLGLAVALQLLHGDIEQLRREYMVLFTRGVSITRKLGFSDVIMPGTAHTTNNRT